MRFLPDGRALVITKGGWSGPGTGRVILLNADGTTERELLQLPVCTDAERGLLGIEISPDFERDSHLYLFYTRQMNDCAKSNEPAPSPDTVVYNRVSRFQYDDDGIDISTQEVLIDELPGHQSSHNAGDLGFLSDGTLLVSTGEAGLARSADLEYLDGKLLRIDVDDPLTPLADNPFADMGGPAGLVYAYGLRNPYRFAVDPATGIIVAADVGTDEIEELNLILAGGFYGFPDVEGPAEFDRGISPFFSYVHDQGCGSAVIGGDFVAAGTIDGLDKPAFVFSDFGCRGIWAVGVDDAGSEGPVRLGSASQTLADLVTGSDGAIYLVPIVEGPIERISFER